MSAELLPGLTLEELQSLLDSASDLEADGDPHILTMKEYAQRRPCSVERARNEIAALMLGGKVEAGPTVYKYIKSINGRKVPVPAYRFLVV